MDKVQEHISFRRKSISLYETCVVFISLMFVTPYGVVSVCN
jgi:hypothetical protein